VKWILLDTSAYSALQRGHQGIVGALQLAEAVYLNSIVLGELIQGFRRGTALASNRARLDRFLALPPSRTIAVDDETAELYALILADLLARGRPLPTNDVWIAASAMQHGLAVVTTDRHFAEIPQIRALILEA
jgi:tRNA(fMet)-specific endonuclease VapC